MKQQSTETLTGREEALQSVIETFRKHLPPGFAYHHAKYGHSFVVPLSDYPDGYHCDPTQPLPFVYFMNQASHLGIYHMGLYAMKSETEWFVDKYKKMVGKKPDMGKSCIRFKDPSAIPYDLLAELAGRTTPEKWIACYESAFKPKKK